LTGPVIELDQVVKRFSGGTLALDEVSLVVPAGERACLLGPNGAGKTTVIRVLNGLLRPNAGQARLFGIATDAADFLAAKRRVGVVPQGPGFYDELTAAEYLELARRVYGRGEVEATAALFDLEPHLAKPMAALSSGFQRRLLMAAALLSEPEVLLLDEPTVGLDPVAAREVRAHLRSAMAGRTVLFSTHNLAEAEALCDSVIVLREGRVLLHEPIATVRQRFPQHALLAARQGPEALTRALSADGFESRIANGAVEVPLANPQDALPDLLRHLLAQGLDVYEAHTVEPSLEDIFVAVVKDGATGGPA